jgi:plasmid stabilization system protein ParE
MKRIAVSEDALKDLHDGFQFYEAQKAGLGDYFATSLRSDIEGLKVTGGMHRLVYRDYRRLLGRVFPYAIFYTVEGDVATVWAVIDCRRDPDWIRRHLDT